MGGTMPLIQLRQSRIEMIEGRAFALFHLSDTPDPAWIVRFEECLAKHSGAAVAVVDRRVRVVLPHSEDFSRLIELVRRCIDEANLDGELSAN
jgi:hypothetical protein